MKKLWDLKIVFSNLELKGQGRSIIMGVTRLLLLGQFYTIQTQTDQTFWRGVYMMAKHCSFFHYNSVQLSGSIDNWKLNWILRTVMYSKTFYLDISLLRSYESIVHYSMKTWLFILTYLHWKVMKALKKKIRLNPKYFQTFNKISGLLSS